MSKRKGARQGPRPGKFTVVNRGLDLFSEPPTDDSIFGIEPHQYCPDSDSATPQKTRQLDETKRQLHSLFRGTDQSRQGHRRRQSRHGQNMAFSAISHIEIKINGRQVNMPTPKSFVMAQWLRAFLNMSDDEKKTWGTLQGYMPKATP